MKKLNNKGFAISTIIYGLSIMGLMIVAILLETMSTTRLNTRQLVNDVEDNLVRLDEGTKSFAGKNEGTHRAVQRYTVPMDGWYRIELWGAKGGTGSFGTYVAGVIYLTKGTETRFEIGQVRTNATGWSSSFFIGEETDAIMTAAGGGKNSNIQGGTIVRYNSTMKSNDGRLKVGFENDFKLTTQDFIGRSAPPTYNPSLGDYTAGTATYLSHINGYALPDSYVDTPSRYFVNGIMLSGVNQGDGKGKIELVAAGGKDAYKRKNKKLDKVKYIRDCIYKPDGSKNVDFTIDGNAWKAIVAIADGKKLSGTLQSATEVTENSKTYVCRILKLNSVTKVDEIAVWHNIPKGKVVYGHALHVSETGVTGSWDTGHIKGLLNYPVYIESETEAGFHVSAYQFDSTTTLPDAGTYYLLPILSENKVMTAPSSSDAISKPIDIELLTGESRQKWSIEKVNSGGNNQYKILELARHYSLKIRDDENLVNNVLTTEHPYNSTRVNDSEKWKVIPLYDGTYEIRTVLEPPDPDACTKCGNLVPALDESSSLYNSGNAQVIVGKHTATTRFRLIPVD